jgi:hypothetical protein
LSISSSLPLPYKPAELPAELPAVVAAWPALPEAIRAGIVAMVRASLGAPENPDNTETEGGV